MNIKVITAAYIGNERDTVTLTPQEEFEGVEYIAYTNNKNLNVYPWKTIVDENVLEMRLNARHKKTQMHKLHPEADYWMWIDSYCKINVDPNQLINKYLTNYDMVTCPHPERNNIIEEGNVILQWKPEQAEGVQEGVVHYLEQGYTPTTLFESKIIIQRNTQTIRVMQDDWWKEIQKYSIRDQISLPYVIWKHGIAVNVFPGTHSETQLRHNNKPWLSRWQEVTQ